MVRGDAYIVSKTIAYANYSYEVLGQQDTYVFHHNTDCEADFTENGLPSGTLASGQPARAFARQFWGDALK